MTCVQALSICAHWAGPHDLRRSTDVALLRDSRRVGRTRRPSVGLVAVAVGAVLFYMTLPLVEPGPVRAAIGDAALLAAAFFGFAHALATWRSTADRAWLFVAGYCALWAVGQAIWAYYELIAHRDVLFPSLADVGYLGAVAFALVAATRLPHRTGRRARIELLDGTVVAVSLVILSLAFLGSSIPADTNAGDVWLAIIYPAADVAVMTAMITAVPSVAASRRTQSLYVVAGFAAITVADIWFAALSTAGDYATGHPIDLGWACGFVLIATGAHRARAASAASANPSATADHRGPTLLLPYLFVAPAAATVLWVELAQGAIDDGFIFLGLALVSVLAVRNGLTLIESERRAAALEREMTFDALTGLWNRRTVTRHIARLADSDTAFAVVALDVDGLKDINDSLGHDAGDIVLSEVAGRIRRCVGRADVVARIGGDEFAIVLLDISQVADAIRIVVQLYAEFSDPLPIHGIVRQITVTAGIAGPGGAGAGVTALENAEFAMYAAKRRGKKRYEVFEPRLHANALERIELSMHIGRAVSRNEFVVHYQPAILLRDESVFGAEALIRWRHPTRGLLRPSEFMPLVEATPHVDDVGRWILEEACRFSAQLMRDGLVDDDFHMSVNVSPRQLYSDAFVASVERAIADAGVPPRSLVLELTESSFIDIDQAVPTLSAIRALGVRLAVDDFGTGYSSLSYLHRLPLDVLKIDKSFVSDVDRGIELRAMARAILAMAKSLRLTTVAEGVERPSQLDELRTYGCIAAQGYLWSAPLPAARFTALLAARAVKRPGNEPGAASR